MLKDDDLLDAIESDWRTAAIGSRREAILDYVDRLTREPWTVRQQHVDQLRTEGLSDADVLAVCECASYYAYVNRIADGLGVRVEPWFRDEDRKAGES